MAPLLLLAAGLVALGAAAAILRSFGPRYRVGRLIAAAPRVSVAEARRIAESGQPGYVRVAGRIDSDAEFEDADHRPLVLRRTTLAWRRADGTGPWTELERETEAVPFVVREGLDEIGVATEALAEGLVVVPRESRGRAADLGDAAPADLAPDAHVRRRIEQVSTVEHATVLGVPARAADGTLVLQPGLGRPLILTTLEDDEAMRVLTGGAIGRARVAVACLVVGAGLIAAAALWWLLDAVVGGGTAAALAASPEPSMRPGNDTRTPGQGPGLVGDPALAIVQVLGIGLLAAAASLAYVRITAGRGTRAAPGEPSDRASKPRPR